ncbi:sugar ABC transporter permease [Actinotalea sp. M2MS4P-6]|uniref:carbohydrate ABC transporter permease n=1 Tax=Actinotalea sp. M2MS4P-6 TaxID=2983762 RepID=UPI0021E4B678|nr:sugar ABC transporter permease [Actinotalea sp. M2MS4P-6]MCV2394346.1 sugar ABC transporter permease [Actinotalea sp. M2MS4P-6]
MSPKRAGLPSSYTTAARGGLSAKSSPRVERHRGGAYRLWFALPAILLVAFFFAGPFLANGVLSFTKWTGFSSEISFNGLDNFRSMISLGILGHSTLVTIGFAATTMLVQNTVGLALAKALQDTNRLNSVYRTIFFVPVLMSPLAAGYIWSAMLAPDGPINAFISLFVPGDFTYSWLGSESTALVAVGFIDAWKWSGLVTLVYIAGLNSIPRQMIEAALIDGASAWRRFRSIEVPMLAPSFTFNIVITLVGSFSALDVIFATTKGGPGDATSVLNVAVYRQYGQGLFGTSSALSFMIAILVILTAVPLIWALRKREVNG